MKPKEYVVQISYYKNKYNECFDKDRNSIHGSHSYYVGFNDNKIIFSADTGIDYIIRKATPEEIEKVVGKMMKIGAPNIEISIFENYVIFNGERIEKDDILKICNFYNPIYKLKVGNNNIPVKLDKNIRCIRIGCTAMNYLFSLGEIEEVLKKMGVKINYLY